MNGFPWCITTSYPWNGISSDIVLRLASHKLYRLFRERIQPQRNLTIYIDSLRFLLVIDNRYDARPNFNSCMQVDDEDTSPRAWNNVAEHTRAIISFLYTAVSEARCACHVNSSPGQDSVGYYRLLGVGDTVIYPKPGESPSSLQRRSKFLCAAHALIISSKGRNPSWSPWIGIGLKS